MYGKERAQRNYIKNVTHGIVYTRDGNFSLPLPTSPRAGFPRLAKVVGQ